MKYFLLPKVKRLLQRDSGAARTRWPLLLLILAAVMIALIPLYGIFVPPLVDLPQHILVSKLMWEKVFGISQLDLDIPVFLGYRLFSWLAFAAISVFNVLDIPFVHLPWFLAALLIFLHTTVVVTVIFVAGRTPSSWDSRAITLAFGLPAVVSIYSACWFIGFVGYVLAVTMVSAAIVVTEEFLSSGRRSAAIWAFVFLALTYCAHPFAPAFWLMWALSRAISSILIRSFRSEWKRILALGAIFLPIATYHVLATAGSEMSLVDRSLFSRSPFLSLPDWTARLSGLLTGSWLKTDDASDPTFFAVFLAAFFLFSVFVAFVLDRDLRDRRIMLACFILILLSSWFDEKFLPTPGVHWIAFEYRWLTTIYAVCLTFSGVVLVRHLSRAANDLGNKMFLASAAAVTIIGSSSQIIEVRTAYRRFDVNAREYLSRMFAGEPTAGITMPHTPWHPDGTFLSQYICLVEPDCNPPGTSFRNYGGQLYPVVLKSNRRVPRGDLFGHWKFDETNPDAALADSSGNDHSGRANGTEIVSGKFGMARRFNGVSDHIDLPGLDIPDRITVMAWFSSERSRQDGFIVIKNPVNTNWALFLTSDGFINWRGAGAHAGIKCEVPSANEWHHLAATQDEEEAYLYLNGQMCASGRLPAIGNSISSISIGRYDTIGFNYFTGRIDDVRIYNRALSVAEIASIRGQ